MSKKKMEINVDNTNTVTSIAILAVIVLALGLAYSTKLYGDLRFDNRVLQEKREAASTLESNVQSASSLQEAYQQLQQRGVSKESVFAAIPPELNYAEQATNIENIATINGMGVTGIVMNENDIVPLVPNPQDNGQPNPQPQSFTITVEVSGDYSNFKDFTADLVNSVRPYRFIHAEITGEGGVVVAELELESVYSPYVAIEPATETIQ